MITSAQCLKKYGDPNLLSTQSKYFEVWEVPQDIRDAFSHVRFTAVGTVGFPKRIFVNKDFKKVLEQGLRNVITRGYTQELKTWDGCFMIRKKAANSSMSLHSWAIAIDINAGTNGYNKKVTMSRGLANCFIDAGMHWGGDWVIKDGMHFQLSKF